MNVGKSVKIIKGKDKGMIGTITGDMGDNYMEINVPGRALLGKNTKSIYKKDQFK